jgi:hypothetical protein
MIVQGTVVGFLVIFTWIGVLVGLQWLQASDSGPSFRMETDHIMVQLNKDPAKVYDEASPALHDAMIKDRFLAIVREMHRTLGKYKSILSIKHRFQINGPHGKTASAIALLQFENANAEAELSYHLTGEPETWRLLGFWVTPPPELTSLVSTPTLVNKREAPREVHEAVESILQRMRDGKVREVYEQASKPFRESVSIDSFIRGVQWRRSHMGRFERVLDIITSDLNASRKRAIVEAVLEYRKGKTRGTFHFIVVDDKWRLLSLKILIPQPLAPTRASGPKGRKIAPPSGSTPTAPTPTKPSP